MMQLLAMALATTTPLSPQLQMELLVLQEQLYSAPCFQLVHTYQLMQSPSPLVELLQQQL